MKNIHHLLIIILISVLFPAAAGAQDHVLSEDTVRDFYDRVKVINKTPYSEYEAFMRRSVRDDAKMKIYMENYFSPEAVVKNTALLDKRKYMANLPQIYSASQTTDVRHDLTEITISPDGKTARTKDKIFLSGLMDMPATQLKIKVRMRSEVSCDDVITISDNGQPQIKASTCTARNYLYPNPQ